MMYLITNVIKNEHYKEDEKLLLKQYKNKKNPPKPPKYLFEKPVLNTDKNTEDFLHKIMFEQMSEEFEQMSEDVFDVENPEITFNHMKSCGAYDKLPEDKVLEMEKRVKELALLFGFFASGEKGKPASSVNIFELLIRAMSFMEARKNTIECYKNKEYEIKNNIKAILEEHKDKIDKDIADKILNEIKYLYPEDINEENLDIVRLLFIKTEFDECGNITIKESDKEMLLKRIDNDVKLNKETRKKITNEINNYIVIKDEK